MGGKTLKKGYSSIGKVVEVLKKEFDNISISKVRYLEEEGLIEPRRTPGGYRRFTQRDIERLRLILKLQNEKYLPLRVIREKIRHLDSGRVKAGDLIGVSKEEEIRPKKTLVETERRKYTLEEASEKTGLSLGEINELVSYGLVRPDKGEKGETFSWEDIQVMHLVKSFSRHGIQARHLRMYQSFAERESALLEQLVAPVLKQKSEESRQKALQTLAQLSQLSQQLRETLLLNHLRSFIKQT